jgi:hypothetical protein
MELVAHIGRRSCQAVEGVSLSVVRVWQFGG